MLKNGFIADVPLIFAAIDPCICCAERSVAIVDARTRQESLVSLSSLRNLSLRTENYKTRKREAEWPL